MIYYYYYYHHYYYRRLHYCHYCNMLMGEERFIESAWNIDVSCRTDSEGKMKIKMERRLYKDERDL